MLRYCFGLTLLFPVACAQVAGLNEEYTVAEDAGTDASSSSGGISSSGGTTQPDSCSQLTAEKNPCSYCVTHLSACTRGACETLDSSIRQLYFACLDHPSDKGADDCTDKRFNDSIGVKAQDACILTCGQQGFCDLGN